MGLFINDGATRKGYVDAVRGLHPAFKFEYRPMLAEDRDALIDSYSGKPGREQTRIIAVMMADRIKWWDAVDEKGNAVPISVELLRRMQPSAFNRLHSILAGGRPSDAFPDGMLPDEVEDFRDYLKARIEGGDVGEVRQEREEKN